MLDINTKVQWRTGGRGVFRIMKGTIIAYVKAGTLPKTKAMQEAMPHGTKLSNRSRYIVEIRDGIFAWANAKTTYTQGEKMPTAKHRFGVPSSTKPKAKKAKVKKAKAIKTNAAKRIKAPKPKVIKTNAATPKLVKADKPKTTWYGIVDGKIVSVRKVVCPDGFASTKPTLPEKQLEATAPALAPAAITSDLPTA